MKTEYSEWRVSLLKDLCLLHQRMCRRPHKENYSGAAYWIDQIIRVEKLIEALK